MSSTSAEKPSQAKPDKDREVELNFELWDNQLEAFTSPATDLGFGGSAGGGKSHLERVLSISLCLDIPGLQYFLFRRSYSDLVKSYIEGPTGYLKMLGPLIKEGKSQHVAKEIRFNNGSKIYLCHCQHEKDVFSFGSFEFHVLNIAEAGEFSAFMMNFLSSRVRAPQEFLEGLDERYVMPRMYWKDQAKKEWLIPRIIRTFNPVGIGKAHLKKTFVDGHEYRSIWRADESEGGMLRQFIPASLYDNPSLDPVQYAARLKGIGNAAYVDALLHGKWDTTIGAFFPQIDRAKHLIKSFMIPRHWPRFMAYDHGACGSGDPFSIGWYTISDGTFPVLASTSGEAILAERGSMICYRRWNGAGLPKMSAYDIAQGIKQREASDENILFRVAGGDILENRGHGESIFSIFSKEGINFRRADMRRQNGWAQVDYRLSGKNDVPLSFWFEECEEDLETIGNLQHDLSNPSDVAQGDDHDGDRHRYACMTRPFAIDAKVEEEVVQSSFRPNTVNRLIKRISNRSTSTSYVTR